jgi:hypothetical protein
VTESDTAILRLPNTAAGAGSELCPVLIWEEIFDFDEKKLLGFYVRRPERIPSPQRPGRSDRSSLAYEAFHAAAPVSCGRGVAESCESSFLGAESAAFWTSRNLNPKLVLFIPVSRTRPTVRPDSSILPRICRTLP